MIPLSARLFSHWSIPLITASTHLSFNDYLLHGQHLCLLFYSIKENTGIQILKVLPIIYVHCFKIEFTVELEQLSFIRTTTEIFIEQPAFKDYIESIEKI